MISIKQFANSYKRIVLLISSTSAIAGLSNIIIGLIDDAPLAYHAVALYLAFVFTMNLIIAYKFSASTSKLFYSLVTPTWYFFGIIFVGGGFAEGASIIANLGFVFVFFRDNLKLRNYLITYGLIISTLSYAILNLNGPLFELYNHPLDEIFGIFLCAFWLYLIFVIYERENQILLSKLKSKNSELEYTNKELEEFTYIASHDLKSPVRNILSFTSLIERDLKNEDSKSTAEYLSYVKSGARQLNDLITDVLEFSEIQNDQQNQKEDINLNQVTEAVKLALYQEIEESKAQIKSEDLPTYYCNETQMKLVFQNLIQNGIKYNQSEVPIIEISSKKKDNFIEIHFKDNGIGIDEQYFDTIFDFFKRLHTKADYEGTGIGLGLCKKIINKMGGQISLKSQLGKGSTFIVKLPLSN